MNEIVAYIEQALKGIYPPHELRDMAWWIAEETTGLSRTQLLCGCKGTKEISDLQIIVSRLRKKEPLQYIFGHTLWCGLDLRLSPATLIPRPETAEMVTLIGDRMRAMGDSPMRVLDIGTGSGCIAIALKQRHPHWVVSGMDISAEALRIAALNAERNATHIEFIEGDILRDTVGQYDIVVSNPPYICEREKADMDTNVLAYEPASALFVPDDDPLLFYRRIARLRCGEYIFFELNEHYAQAAAEMLCTEGYTDIQITRDSYDKPRILSGRMAPTR